MVDKPSLPWFSQISCSLWKERIDCCQLSIGSLGMGAFRWIDKALAIDPLVKAIEPQINMLD
ncbi:MAG TPA: hypothetical protein VJ772_06095 [Nitrososphaeraceae archaeon]|nr:hypothetical protein [Nitrososphaeraceae archaeon]